MRGFTLWVTGPSCQNNSILSRAIEEELLERGMKVELLNIDAVQSCLLGDSDDPLVSINEGMKSVGFIAHLLTRNDVVAICSYPSPRSSSRDEMRKLIGRFVEVYCECALDNLKKQGISMEEWNAYEKPDKPEVICDLEKEGHEECAHKILKTLEILGFIPPSDDDEAYSEDEEDKIRQRLQDLGYI